MTAAERHLNEAEADQLTIRGLESYASTSEDIRNSSTEDYVFNYYSNCLKMGLLKRNFQGMPYRRWMVKGCFAYVSASRSASDIANFPVHKLSYS